MRRLLRHLVLGRYSQNALMSNGAAGMPERFSLVPAKAWASNSAICVEMELLRRLQREVPSRQRRVVRRVAVRPKN